MEYDTHLFLEIIESIHGISFIRTDSSDGFSINLYKGLTGRTVFIDISDDSITEEMGRGYLAQLGIQHLIPSLFPEPENINQHPIQHYCGLESCKILKVRFHNSEDELIGRVVAFETNPSPYPLKGAGLNGRFKIIEDVSEYLKNGTLDYVEEYTPIDLTKDLVLEIIDIS